MCPSFSRVHRKFKADVFLVAPILPPFVGGSAVYYYTLINYLKKFIPLIVITQLHKGKPLIEKSPNLRIYRILPPVLQLHKIIRWTILFFTTPLIILYFYIKFKPKMIHLHSSTPFTRLFLILARAIQLPIILDVRDGYFTDMMFLEEKIKHYVVVSKLIYNKLISKGIPKEKITIHHVLNPPSILNLSPNSHLPRINCTNIKMIFIGELSKEKGIDILLNAFQQVCIFEKNVELTIIGTGSLEKYCKKYVEKHNINEKVKILGKVDYKLAQCLMAHSDLVILPSLSEGMPRVILESLSLGVPVLATDTGAVKEIIKEGVNGILISPNNTLELTGVMLKFIKDKNLRKKLRAGARKMASLYEYDECRWIEITMSFLSLYEISLAH